MNKNLSSTTSKGLDESTRKGVMERPILFSGPMVRAILGGHKTQTRRIVKPPPSESFGQLFPKLHGRKCEFFDGELSANYRDPIHLIDERFCPYGVAGDRLWVRETWAQESGQHGATTIYRAEYIGNQHADISTPHGCHECASGKWKPSIHMPRWASRITLEITKVRVERLHDITPEDCIAEGMKMRGCSLAEDAQMVKRDYATLWDSINGKGAWEKNPWAWVLEFKRNDAGKRIAAVGQ